jgi:hypothetical protein
MSEETKQLEAGCDLDALVAEKLGKKVVSKDWNCDIDPESGHITPLPYIDPDFEEGYDGITHLRHPVYLRDFREVVTFEDGSMGYMWGNGKKQVIWPPQVNKRDKFNKSRPECYYLAPVEHYTQDVAAAWQVVEYIRQNISKYVWVDSYQHKWIVQIRDAEKGTNILATGRSDDNVPLAICRAFLALDLD